MSSTVIAVAGIAGTLTAPILTEMVKRQSARKDRQYDRRLAVYADMLHAAAKTVDNARNWAAVPLAELDKHDDEFLDRMLAQVRVVASSRVRERMMAFQQTASEFHRRLFEAQLLHRRIRESGDADTGEAIQARMRLGALADEMGDLFKRLEDAVREETTK